MRPIFKRVCKRFKATLNRAISRHAKKVFPKFVREHFFIFEKTFSHETSSAFLRCISLRNFARFPYAYSVPTFNYIAKNSAGENIVGALDAPDRRMAAQRLARRGLSPIRLSLAEGKELNESSDAQTALTAESHPALQRKRAFGTHKIARSFMEKLYSLLTSGLPAGDAIKLLSQRVGEPALRVLCGKIWRDLSEGLPLAGAMAGFPAVFESTDVRLVEAGEATGTLPPVIKRLLDHYESRETLRSKILASMLYPLFIIAFAGGVIALFIFFLMPMLQDMIGKLGGEMNITTRILIGISEALLYGGPVVLVACITAFFSLKNWRESEEGRLKTDAWLLRLPLIGKIILSVESSRLCSLLSTLMENGLNTPDALRMAERAAGNRIEHTRIAAARKLISDGASFTNAFRRHEVLPQIDLDIVTVGESTGTLPAAFRQLAQTHEKNLDAALRRLIVTLSGVLLSSAVAIVFLCLLSIVLTIFSVSQSAAQ